MFLRIDYDAVALAQIGDLGPQLDHFAHVFVTENIPGLHGGLIAVQQVKIRTRISHTR
jgi:hypothetical protein